MGLSLMRRGLVDRAVLAVRDPAGRVGMIPEGLVGMILVGPEGRLQAPNRVVRVDPGRLVVPNRVARADPGNREATAPRMGRALLGLMPTHLPLTAGRPVRKPTRPHLTAARRRLMPALLHLTPVDRRTAVDPRWDPTTRAVAACPVVTRAVAIRAVVATPAAAATPS